MLTASMIQFIIRDKTSFATFCFIEEWPSSKLKQIDSYIEWKKRDVYSNAPSRAKVAKNMRKTRQVIVPILVSLFQTMFRFPYQFSYNNYDIITGSLNSY